MVELRIAGIDVDFPFEPYAAQLEYMEHVIQALQTGSNALLESPTGTGKTLCLLCACLAWLRQHRTRLASSPLAGTILFSGAGGAQEVPTKIIYCSRTHAQLAQVARELKRTNYKTDTSMALLGSREHMCVNSEVSRLPTTQAQQRMCSALRADHSCRFFRNLQRKQGQYLSEGKQIHDMEDLVKDGRTNGFCPYFHERDASEKADIVLMPYNYMLDPSLRKQLPFPLENAVVVIDEAHNLPGVLSAAGCVNLVPVDLATAIHDTARAIAALRLSSATTEAPSGLAASPTTGSAATLEEAELASLKLVLCRVEAAIAEVDMLAYQTDTHPSTPALASVTGAGELVRPGVSLLSFLGNALITRDVYEGTTGTTGMRDVISKAIALLKETDHSPVGLARVQQFLSTVFQHDPTDYGCTRFVMQDLPPERKSSDGHKPVPTSSASSPPRRSIGFWVLDNSTNLSELSSQARALLLTSGTLSPLDHFAAELGVEFPIRLCGGHVIDTEKQVYSGVLCKGPGGEKLNGSYAFRHNVYYREALGMTLTNMCRITPGGVLVFFPSYSALNSTVDMWKLGTSSAPAAPHASAAEAGGAPAAAAVRTVWGMLSAIKPVFVEPHNTAELTAVVQAFQKTVDESPRRGAVLLAVCRGKVSEGVDFADHHGRCVVVTGIPFANHTDLFVRVKRAYLTEVAPQRPRVSGRLFTGDDWYRNEAMRAVNQSLGRVIRHKDDYGAVVLADERFASHLQELSPWIASRTRVCGEFRECFAALNAFFAPYRTAGRRPRESCSEGPAVDLAAQLLTEAGQGQTPDSADRAKAFALAQEQRRAEEGVDRLRRRLEDVAEQPVIGHKQADTVKDADEAMTITSADTTLMQSRPASSESAPPVLKMTRQQLLPIAVPSPSSPAPLHSLASAPPHIGGTSREFCQYLKQRVSVDSYERFKVLLRQIASYRLRLQNSADSAHGDFRIAVSALRHIFREADPVHDAVLARAFGHHIPPELQQLYHGLLGVT